MPALAVLARSIVTWLGIQRIFGDIGTVSDALNQLGAGFDWLTNVVGDVFKNVRAAEHGAQAHAKGGGQALDQLGNDLKVITHHTYGTVIPNTIAWAMGFIVSHWIDPLRYDISVLRKQVRFLLSWRGQIDAWRHKWVDPELHKWHTFSDWFATWPLGVLTQWHQWFQRPGLFGVWATPPLVGPLIAYFADPAHDDTTDNLAAILVDSTPDVWRHVEQAAVRILHTEV